MILTDIKLEALKDTLRTEKISDAEYFSPKYAAYVSNSRLGNINPSQGGSPEKFFNPMGQIYSDSLILGSAVHQQYLQPEFFELVEIQRPNAKLGFVCDYIWEHSKNHEINNEIIIQASNTVDYYKDALNDKRIGDIISAYNNYASSKKSYNIKEGIEPMFIGPKMYETAIGCLNACNFNNEFKELMFPSYLVQEPISQNEQAFLLDIKCTFPDKDPIIVRLKSKLDNFTINFDTNTITVNDLKTIGAILPKFDGEFGNYNRYRYYRELAIYMFLLKMYAEQKYGMKNPHMYANCLVVSTVPGYNTKVYKATNKEIDKGFKEFRYLMRLVAYYIAYEGYGFK